jgi:type II secretory pathway pseudopilin PulG
MGVAEIVVAALGIVAAVAPGVLAQLTGKQSDEEAIEAARALAQAVPVRTGEDGSWAADLDARKARG